MSTTLRISLTPELEQILNILQVRYPTLSKVELAKLAIGNLYHQQETAGSQLFASITPQVQLDEKGAIEAANQIVKDIHHE